MDKGFRPSSRCCGHLSDFDGLGNDANAHNVTAGCTAGGGVAVKLSDHFAVKLEDLTSD